MYFTSAFPHSSPGQTPREPHSPVAGFGAGGAGRERQGRAVLMRRRSAAVRGEGDSTRLPSTPEGAPALTLRRPRPRPDPALADEATADGKQSGRTPQSQHARETTRLPGRAAPASRSIGTRSRGRPAALGQRSGEKRSWLHAVKREPRNKKCGTRP